MQKGILTALLSSVSLYMLAQIGQGIWITHRLGQNDQENTKMSVIDTEYCSFHLH